MAAIPLGWSDGPGRSVRGGVAAVSGDHGPSAQVLGVEHRLELLRRDFVNPLTGFPNRAALLGWLEEVIGRRARLAEVLADCGLPTADRALVVACLDLDHFRHVGVALGSTAGDEAIRQAAGRLGAAAHTGDLVAHVGDDEFMVVCDHVGGTDGALGYADSLLRGLHGPVAVGDHEVSLTASVGLTVWAPPATSETLLAQASVAMRAAKDAGRNRVILHDASGNGSLDGSPARPDLLDARVRAVAVARALVRGQLTAHFQPVVVMVTGRVLGFEALARWNHPERGVLGPGVFLDAVRSAGLGVVHGEFMMHEACAFARRLVDEHRADEHRADEHRADEHRADGLHVGGSDVPTEATSGAPFVTVNVTTEHLGSRGFVGMLAGALATAGIDGSRIVLELVESDRLDPDGAVARVLDEVRALGVALAIDDFGTGYSSLAYLQRLPVDMLKIDGSFVRDLATNRPNRALVAFVVEAAAVLGLSVTAEGVETPDEAAALLELGCVQAQGYLFGRPVDADTAIRRCSVGTP